MQEYCIELPDEPGQMATLCEALAARDINILTCTAMTATGAVVAIITNQEEDTSDVLNELGYTWHQSEVMLVTLPHKPGALAGLSRTMANAGINIKSVYIMSRNEEEAIIAFTADDPTAAKEMI